MVRIIVIIVMTITMSILEIILNTLYSNKGKIEENTDKENYEVSIPEGAALIFKIQFWFGIFLFVFFGIIKLLGNESVTLGNFVVCAIVCFFGLWAEISFKNKKLIVKNDTIIIHKFLHKEKIININEIDAKVRTKKTGYGTASQIVLSKNNRVLIRIDDIFLNYTLLEEKLKSIGKILDNNN